MLPLLLHLADGTYIVRFGVVTSSSFSQIASISPSMHTPRTTGPWVVCINGASGDSFNITAGS